MNTKILMLASAIFMASIGIILTFLPQEVLQYLGINAQENLVIIMQILGAIYIGVAMLNWMAKNILIGGIYNRPIVMGNAMLFTISAFTLVKSSLSKGLFELNILIALTLIYTIFAISFLYLLFNHPKELSDKH